MNQYEYFILGIVLGLAIAIYFVNSRSEQVEKAIAVNKRLFSTKRFDNLIENSAERIKDKISEVKRELTEEEKNEIIAQCCKEKFYL